MTISKKETRRKVTPSEVDRCFLIRWVVKICIFFVSFRRLPRIISLYRSYPSPQRSVPNTSGTGSTSPLVPNSIQQAPPSDPATARTPVSQVLCDEVAPWFLKPTLHFEDLSFSQRTPKQDNYMIRREKEKDIFRSVNSAEDILVITQS